MASDQSSAAKHAPQPLGVLAGRRGGNRHDLRDQQSGDRGTHKGSRPSLPPQRLGCADACGRQRGEERGRADPRTCPDQEPIQRQARTTHKRVRRGQESPTSARRIEPEDLVLPPDSDPEPALLPGPTQGRRERNAAGPASVVQRRRGTHANARHQCRFGGRSGACA